MKLLLLLILSIIQWKYGFSYYFMNENVTDKVKEVNGICGTHLNEYVTSLMKFDGWALSMFDATSKLPSGLTEGFLADLGQYDLCLSIREEIGTQIIKGKYCLGVMTLALSANTNSRSSNVVKPKELLTREEVSLSWIWSFCIPDSCDGKVGAEFLSSALSFNGMSATISEMYPEKGIICQTQETISQKLDTGAIVAVAIFSTVLGLMVLQTAYDAYLSHFNKQPYHILLISFSVVANGRKLLRVVKSPDQLSCLDGIRFISIMWVVLGHRYSITLETYSANNSLDMIRWADHLYSMYVGAATVAVDTFFLVGGLLVTYGYMKAMSKGIPFNIPVYYLHRYIRLTPALAALVLMIATLAPYMTNGPDYPSYLMFHSEPCVDYWWTAILYVQNYANINRICVGHTWYLNVDMQLFILSPLVLIPLKKWPKRTLSFIGLLTILCMSWTFYLSSHYKLSGVITNVERDALLFSKVYYLQTHARASPWLIGLILGYYVFKIKNNEVHFKPTWFVSLALWAASASVLLACLLSGHSTLRGPEYDIWGNALHITFIRPAWAMALCWLILACLFGQGGPVNWFLSRPIFQVLNRLTYSIYLIHVSYMYAMAYARRTSIHFSDYDMMYLFWGDFIFSGALAVIWTLAFESPMIIIERVLFGNIGKKQELAKKKNEESQP